MVAGIGIFLRRPHIWRLGCLALTLIFLGCARDQDYLDVMHQQQAAWREVTEILQTVKDAPTMAAAQKMLQANAEKYAAISRQADALPKPPPPKVLERMKEEQYFVLGTLDHLKEEVKRVSKLPGGPEFLKQFESTKGLLSAVEIR